MAYKVGNRGSRARAQAGSLQRDEPQAAPLIKSLSKAIRAASTDQLPRLSRAAARMASGSSASPRTASALLILAAEAARSVGYLSSAEAYLAQADTRLPAFASDLLFHLRSEQIRLNLDQGQLRTACTLAARVDCTVIERGLEKPLIEREASAVTPDTLLLQAEMALAAAALSTAERLLNEAREANVAQTATGATTASSGVLDSDRNDYLRLLQAILVCRKGDSAQGQELLEVLQARLEMDGVAANRVILARVRAASGDWVEVDMQPPAGINVLEARRWQAMSRPLDKGATQELFDGAPETVSSATALTNAPPLPPSSPVFVPQEMFAAYSEHLRQATTSVATELTARFTEQMRSVLDGVSRSTESRSEGHIYGGRFPHIEVASVVMQAEMGRVTGLIRVRWNTANVETTIQAGRLSPLARCGLGYIYVHDGTIIDATLCTEEPTPKESASMDDALAALTAILQVGIGVCLDHKPEGEAYCFPDERVRERFRRIAIPEGASQNLMQSLVVAVETKHGRAPAEDTFGEWEK